MNRKIVTALTVAAAVAGGVLFWTRFGTPTPGPFVPTAAEQEELAFYSQPENWFLQNLQAPPELIDGARLDPKMQYLAEQMRPSAALMEPLMPLIFATTPGRRWVRNAIDRSWTLYTKVTAPMHRVQDRRIPGRAGEVPVRMYHPQTAQATPLPVLVYAHGGGWVFASVAALDRAVRLIANEAQAIVISVDYRLAPEHPHPAGSDDVEDAFLWARAQAAVLGGDPARVAVGGDSAGGYAAINAVQRQLAAGQPPPVALLLYYPGTGLPQPTGSYEKFARGYGLDASFIDFILPLVFPGRTLEDARDDFIDPLRARSLRGFPPTILTTPGYDILRDSGRAFAQRLQTEGAQVAYYNYGSLTHSFLQFSGVVADAERAATETAQRFGRTLRAGALVN